MNSLSLSFSLKPVDQQMDAQVLGSKEICLIERSLFVLSLIPIAINLCVKANLKKPISTIIQPILDFYQIKLEKCTIYLVSIYTYSYIPS